MVIKRVMLLALLLFVGLSSLAGATPEINNVDLFEIEQGKVVWETNNSDTIQNEAKKWIDSIKGFYDVETILDLGKDGYCLRIPTEPIRVKNELMDTTIQDVFLYLGKDHKPLLLLFDVRWPARYLMHFSADVRPYLKKLGIWKFVNDKKYGIHDRG